jgi:hypothetical protein
MSYLPSDEINPFQAPKARIGGLASEVDDTDLGHAELIRREHISHESSIRTLGILYYLGCFFGLIATFFMFLMGSGVIPLPQNNPNMPADTMRYFFLGAGAFYFFITILFGFLGYGLRKLQVWARWTILVLTSLSLLYTLGVSVLAAFANPIIGLVSLAIGSIIPGYILYLVASPKAGMIFSAEYKAIILKTPHVKAKTSLLVKIVLVLLVGLILFLIIGGISNR